MQWNITKPWNGMNLVSSSEMDDKLRVCYTQWSKSERKEWILYINAYKWNHIYGSWHCTGGRDQDHPPKKKYKKAKWLSEEPLQIAVKRREMKDKGEKERYTHLNGEFQRRARRDKKPSLVINAKKKRKTTERESLETSSRK